MNQIKFKTSKAEGVLVRVPEGYNTVFLGGEIEFRNSRESINTGLSTSEYKAPYLVSDLTEQQWAEVVDDESGGHPGYADYEDYRYSHESAISSSKSLMRSLGINQGNWVMILRR